MYMALAMISTRRQDAQLGRSRSFARPVLNTSFSYFRGPTGATTTSAANIRKSYVAPSSGVSRRSSSRGFNSILMRFLPGYGVLSPKRLSGFRTRSFLWNTVCKSGMSTLALMFVMGLDMLFMAGETDAFMKRLGGFLGVDSYVFPPDSIMNWQPNTTVRDVLKDLYDFRNIIAHGQEIPEHPYRQKCDLMSTDGDRINYDDYYRAELMLESSLFMLTTTLRRIFTEGLIEEVKNTAKWRSRMALYEHRYKDSNGPASVKTRGR